MIKEFYLGDGKTPNRNGRIYSQEVIDKMVDQLNTGKIHVVKPGSEKVEPDLKDVIGIVESAKQDESGITCKIQVRPTVFEEFDKIIEVGHLSPNGVSGYVGGTPGEPPVVDHVEYKLVSITVGPEPVFFETLDLDDIDFEEIVKYFKENCAISMAVANWAKANNHRIGPGQIQQIAEILHEVLGPDA